MIRRTLAAAGVAVVLTGCTPWIAVGDDVLCTRLRGDIVTVAPCSLPEGEQPAR